MTTYFLTAHYQSIETVFQDFLKILKRSHQNFRKNLEELFSPYLQKLVDKEHMAIWTKATKASIFTEEIFPSYDIHIMVRKFSYTIVC